MKRLKTGDKVTYKTMKGILKTATVQRAFYNADCDFLKDNNGFSLEAWCDKTGNMLLLFKNDLVINKES